MDEQEGVADAVGECHVGTAECGSDTGPPGAAAEFEDALLLERITLEEAVDTACGAPGGSPEGVNYAGLPCVLAAARFDQHAIGV